MGSEMCIRDSRPPSDQPCAPFRGDGPGEGRPRARPLSVGDWTRPRKRHSDHAGVPSRPGQQGRPRATRTDRDARRASAQGEVGVRNKPAAVTRRQRAGPRGGRDLERPFGARPGHPAWICASGVRWEGGDVDRDRASRGHAPRRLRAGSSLLDALPPGTRSRVRVTLSGLVVSPSGSPSRGPSLPRFTAGSPWSNDPGHPRASGSRVCGLAPPTSGRVTLKEAGSPRSAVPMRRRGSARRTVVPEGGSVRRCACGEVKRLAVAVRRRVLGR